MAEKHYLQVTDGHWERAGRVQFGGVTGGVIPDDLAELIKLWPELSQLLKSQLLIWAKKGVG
ncbi:MAG: hypothetical protein KDA87_26680 [Planctomycetales bacterium]|nr:hypothetical protein [Planctomycetales bacterium]